MTTEVLTPKKIESTERFWSANQILMTTYFSGLLGGCYLLGKNFKKLGLQSQAKKTYWIAFLGTFALALLMACIPDDIFDKIPKFIFPMPATLIIGFFARKLELNRVDEKKEQGAKNFPFWKSLLMTLLLAAIQFALLFSMYVLIGVIFPQLPAFRNI